MAQMCNNRHSYDCCCDDDNANDEAVIENADHPNNAVDTAARDANDILTAIRLPVADAPVPLPLRASAVVFFCARIAPWTKASGCNS